MTVKIGKHSNDLGDLEKAFYWWLDIEESLGLDSRALLALLALELSRKEHQDIQFLKESYGFYFYVDGEDCLALKKIAAKAGLRYWVE